jgi:hypothetical protein
MSQVPIVVPPQPPAAPPPGLLPLAQSNADRAIELIQAQIAGVKQEIAELTSQLTPGASRMREQAIDVQLSGANERLDQLQNQLDRVVSGETPIVVQPPDFSDFERNAIPRDVVNIIEMVLVSTCVIALGLPIVRMLSRRFERRAAPDSLEVSGRFDRLEQAVDAVAIEVERMSEGQRYSAKVLNELRALPSPNPLDQWPPSSRSAVKEELKG